MRRMKLGQLKRTAKKNRYLIGFLISAVVIGLIILFLFWLHSADMVLLRPKGLIAERQAELINLASLLSLIVVVPVFAMTFFIAWKYRAGNKRAKYQPDWDHSRLAETAWWIVPLILITILSVITWKSTHELDPYKPLASQTKPVEIQVVALQWKWLFIYPKQNIATVNYIQFPEDTPVNFTITADAPMNSFWIPRLGGQVYAMAGMSTKLHLMADHIGEYPGGSANLSGAGFSGMRFTAKASSLADFDSWVHSVKQSSYQLNRDIYAILAKPSENAPVTQYASSQPGLYDTIVSKFMTHHASEGHPPGEHQPHQHDMQALPKSNSEATQDTNMNNMHHSMPQEGVEHGPYH